jgi:hypothetical protein
VRYIPAKYAGRQVALALLEDEPPPLPSGEADPDVDPKDLLFQTLQQQERPLADIKGPSIAGTYRTFKEQFLKGRTRRKLENNTYAELLPDESIGIRLHNTHVVTAYPDDSVKIDFGGWHTVTTRARMNQYLPSGWGIYTEKNTAYWSIAGFGASDPMVEIKVPANSGDAIFSNGLLHSQEPPVYKRLRKRAFVPGGIL